MKCAICGEQMVLRLIDYKSSAMVSYFCKNCTSKKEKQKEKEDKELKDFQNFVDGLKIAYRGFCLCEILHTKIETELYGNINYRDIWDAILRSLEENYKRWVVNILEQPPKFLKFDNNYQKTIDKCYEWRKKYFGHYDKKFLLNQKGFLLKNYLQYEEMDDLFNKIIKITEEYNRKFNLSFDIKDIKRSIMDKSDKWLNNFKKPSFWKIFF